MLRAKRSNVDIIDIGGELWSHGQMPVFDGDAKIGPPVPGSAGQMQMDAQLLACVTFDEGPAKGMEISVCLNEWLNYVLNSVIPEFEKFFA
jgi:hypothetical protein